MNKWDYIQLKGFYGSKRNHQESEKPTYRMGKYIYKTFMCDKGLISKIHKKSYN